MFAYQRKKVGLALALADIALVSLAFLIAYQTRVHIGLEREFFLTPKRLVVLLLVSLASWIAVAAYSRLYEHLDSAQWTRVIRSTFRQCAVASAFVVFFEYTARWDLSRSFLFLLFGYALVFLSVFRLNSEKIIRRFLLEFGSPYHVVLIGERREAENWGRQLTEGSPFRVRISHILSEQECHLELFQIIQHEVLDEVIFRIHSDHLSDLEDVFLLCDEAGIRTRVAADFFPHVNSQMTLDRFGTTSLLTFSAAPDDDLRLVVKRFFDIVFAFMVLLLTMPFLLLIALVIRITSPGPALFSQIRAGLNGRNFRFYKFRSMVQNAEQLQAELEHLNEKTTAFKISNDPRLTPLGRWLRKFSIDEMPQFFNVLRGDMSLVGPRPAIPGEIEKYQRWQRRRLRMRPGLTCLWVIRGRDHLTFDEWMKMDLEYIDHWSLLLDVKILLKTIPRVLLGRGAH